MAGVACCVAWVNANGTVVGDGRWAVTFLAKQASSIFQAPKAVGDGDGHRTVGWGAASSGSGAGGKCLRHAMNGCNLSTR